MAYFSFCISHFLMSSKSAFVTFLAIFRCLSLLIINLTLLIWWQLLITICIGQLSGYVCVRAISGTMLEHFPRINKKPIVRIFPFKNRNGICLHILSTCIFLFLACSVLPICYLCLLSLNKISSALTVINEVSINGNPIVFQQEPVWLRSSFSVNWGNM